MANRRNPKPPPVRKPPVKRVPAELKVEPAVEQYKIDPAGKPAVVADGRDSDKVRVSRGLLAVVRELAEEEGVPVGAMVNSFVRAGLVAKGVLLPAERLINKRLLTADGTIVLLTRVNGHRVVDVVNP